MRLMNDDYYFFSKEKPQTFFSFIPLNTQFIASSENKAKKLYFVQLNFKIKNQKVQFVCLKVTEQINTISSMKFQYL